MREVKAEIEALKEELDRLIDNGACFSEVYEVSVRLDKLIVSFYKWCECGLN